MKVVVTAIDRHPVEGYPAPFHHSFVVGEGQHLVVGSTGVMVDLRPVLTKDRRRRVNRVAGHPWVDKHGNVWTGFSVEVEP
jgi:hypothetical protein